MKRTYTPTHMMAATAGAACLASEIYANCQYTYSQAGSWSDPALCATVVISVSGACALSVAFAALRQCEVFSTLVGAARVLAFGVAALFSLSTTFERTTAQRDTMITKRLSASPEYGELRSESGGLRRQQVSECLTGEGPRCSYYNKRIGQIEYRLSEIKSEADSSGMRIAEMLELDPGWVSRWQPTLLPIALFLFANFLVAFGLDGCSVEPEFVIEESGQAAGDARASRYAETFRSQYGRAPRPIEYINTLGVTPAVAGRYARKFG